MAKATTTVKVTATNDTPAPAAAPISVNNPQTLTVVVVDEKSQPVSGANVSITPENASGVTNSAGEIQFKIGGATKYDVTATTGGNTVTVPYYVTPGGATRVVVNPSYVRTVEKQLHPSILARSPIMTSISIGIVVLIVAYILWKRFTNSRRHR